MANSDRIDEVNRSRKKHLIAETPNGPILPDWNDQARIDLLHYLLIFRLWWRVIAYTTAGIVLITFVVTKFVLIKEYRAVAIIKAISHKSKVAGVASALLGGGGGEMGGLLGQGLGSMGGQAQDHDPEELMAMMRSYAFTVGLVKQYHLIPQLLKESLAGSENPRQWRLYKIMKDHFSCDYDYRADLITMHFTDPDPVFAEEVLQYYVETLRKQLRNQEVGSTTVAIRSLEEEAGGSADALLRDQLYQLVAEQIQDQKMAQMDANYSFRIIEPPMTPDEKYWPSVRQFCLLALFVTPILMVFAIITHQFYLKLARTIRAIEHIPSMQPKDAPSPLRKDF